MKKLILSASLLLSSLILQAQTQIDFGTFVTLRPDLGNQGSSYQRDIVTDPNGNVFGVGQTNISQVPKGTIKGNVVDSTYSGDGFSWDGYVYKLAADGKSLLWWTYLGGTGNDDIWGVDYSKEGANEYIYCTGYTDKDFPVATGVTVKGAYKNQRDAFLAKYNALTGELVWLSWLGSANQDCGFAVKVSANYVHIVGFASKGIPTTTGAYKTTLTDDWTWDGFYSKFDFSGNINYCTYTNFANVYVDFYSRNGANGARGLDIISDNDVIISGTTYGNDVSTEKNNTALKASGNLPSTEVGFILRLNTLGGGTNDCLFSSKIRAKTSSSFTFASDVKYNNGSFYVLGYTNGVIANIPTGAYQETNNGLVDVFVLKIKASDYSIENASMYGGAGNDYAAALTVCSGEPTFSGQTASNNLALVNYLTTGSLSSPTRNLNIFQGNLNDMFTASLKNDFKFLSFSSYLGGSFDEHPFTSYNLNGKPGGLAVSGNKLLIGASSHSFQDMPTTTNALHHVTKTIANNINSPDLDFVVSFQKPGGSCSLIQAIAPDLDIDALNDSATGKDYKTTYIENASAISVVNTKIGGVTITDSDDTNIKSASITLTNTQANDVFTVTLPTGITSTITTSGTNTIITLTGSATKADYQTALTLIKFSNTSDNPNTTDRNITFVVTDNSSSSNSNTATSTIKVKASNDSPVLDLDMNDNSGKSGADYHAEFTVKGPNINIADVDFTITDVDNTTLSSAIISLTNKQLGDTIKVGSLIGGISSFVTSNSGITTIILTGTSSIANYQSAIRNIVFGNTISNPNKTDRNITVQVNDAIASSNVATTTVKFITTNAKPVLDLDNDNSSGKTGADYQTTYTEKGADIKIADTDITITDADNSTLSSATITLTNKQVGDTIKVGALSGGITASLTSNSGSISLTLNGITTLANYQSAIRNIVYGNTSSNPSTTDKFVTVLVNDGTANSNLATTTIKFTAINDSPVLDLDNNNSSGKTGADYQTTYTEKASDKNIADVDISITDFDNTNISSAIISLTNKQLGDTIKVGSLIGGISSFVTSNSGNTTIILTGTSTIANYQSAIRNIVYGNSISNPNTTDRNITVQVNDAIASSNVATTTVKFITTNANPVLDLDNDNSSGKTGADYQTTYTEKGADIKIADTDITITDADNSTLSSATITLTNKQVGDTIKVGALSGGITASLTSNSGSISLTLNGITTLANYQSAIRNIVYGNTSSNPSTTDKFVTVLVNDGTANSNLATTTIKFTAINDSPVLDLDNNNSSGKTGADYQTTYTEKGSDKNIADVDISITDFDNTNISSTTIILTNKQVGDTIKVGTLLGGITSSVVSSAGTITITLTGSTSLANYQTSIRNIVYGNTSSNPSTTDRFVTVQVNDGSANSNLATSTIKIFATNNNPVLVLDYNGSSGKTGADFQTTFIEKSSGVTIGDVDTKITDVDSPNLTSATITLTNKRRGDIIKVGILSGGITVSFDSSQVGKVVITLSGVTTLTNYQNAIRNINFQNNRDDVDTTTRLIQVTVNDGQSNSNIATTYIRVINVNDIVIVKNETVVTNEDVTITNYLTTITSNDFDPDGDVLTVTGIVRTTKDGTINIVGNTYVYDPNKFFFGKDTAIFNVCDPKGACKNDTLFVSVNEVIDNDTITFQDIAFKSTLIALGFDKNADNKIQKKEVASIKKLNISNKSISNLAGIEWFKALDTLNVSFNNLSNINLNALVNLTYLNASNNKLSDVSITNFANQRVSAVAPNTKLQTLLLNNNQLTKLDVSNLLALKVLDARVNSALFQVCVNPSHNLTNFKVDLTTTLTSTCGILTSIENELNNQPKTLVGIYNLIGQKIENEQATNGIYIFVYSDGSREKVLR